MKHNTLIRLKGISRVFHAEEVDTYALNDIDLEIGEGEFVAIEGPSGCGKSTLLAILGLLDRPTEGHYELAGTSVTDLTPDDCARVRAEQIGFVFQTFNLIGDLTVFENVELPLTYRALSTAQCASRVESALARVGMSHRLRHFPAQLSGGQQQRVAIARALAGDPVIVLADEPTGNLDSTNGAAVMELLHELHASGATICMVTHDSHYAAAAQRRIRLHDGRIADDAEPV